MQNVRFSQMSAAIFIEAYSKFFETAQAYKIEDLCLLIPYDKYKLTHSIGYIYDLIENEFTRELLNAINQFSHLTNRIIIWDKVIDGYPEELQFELRMEFLKLPIYYCLNQPFAIKERIMFCATHLCNLASIAKIKDAKDDLPKDYKIGKKHFDEKAKDWPSSKLLAESLQKIASNDYNNKTRNFRNMTHHRIPANIEYGHTNMVTRIGYGEETFEYITIENGKEVKKKKTTKGVSYGIGYYEPLTAKELAPLFREQLDYANLAFLAYWSVIEEHQAK